MTEKDIQIISEQYKDEKAPLYEKIHQRVEEMYVQQAHKRKRLKTFYKAFPVALAMVLIISLVVVLPIVLQPGETTPEGDSVIRYTESDVKPLKLDYNLKEYARINNESFLYIDMDDIAEDVITHRYYEVDNESVTAYLQESLTHGETGYSILLTIIKKNVIVEEYETEIIDPLQFTFGKVTVNYNIMLTRSRAVFEYLDYKYYLDFGNVDSYFNDDFITEIISNMFSTQQAVA